MSALALTVFVAATVALDFARATRARLRMHEPLSPAMGRLLRRHNRRYGGFIVHVGILVIAVGITGSHAWSVQTEVTVQRDQAAELAGYRFRFDGLRASEESNHSKVTGVFTVTNGSARPVTLLPAKKFYPQEMAPIAYVDYRLGMIEDVYLVLGDFALDGSQATVKMQVNRLVSWIRLGGRARKRHDRVTRRGSRRRRRRIWTYALAGSAVLAFAAGTAWIVSSPTPAGGPPPAALMTEVAQQGRALFDRHCASCHGINAAGTSSGPALVHRAYHPSHHADAAFELAVRRGVRAHHWRFGDMPPQPSITAAEVAQITTYVRALQKGAGIF